LVLAFFFSFLSQASIFFSQQIERSQLFKIRKAKKLELIDDLYDLDGKKIDTTTITEGKVLLNVWASWCITCLVEHPFLKEITQDKDVRLIGISYKDLPENAERYLEKNGNPYVFSISDFNGSFSLKLGVTGAPETFLIIDGEIVRHRIGEVNLEVWNEKFKDYF
jgi:cytochrome c biogenesis protein CcmG/thiol:disulfide interchange protein DsbE